jgi:hypothetical protein
LDLYPENVTSGARIDVSRGVKFAEIITIYCGE